MENKNTNESRVTKTICPCCSNFILAANGSMSNPSDGVTVWCDNKDCRMTDWGHGKNEKDALEIFLLKCNFSNK